MKRWFAQVAGISLALMVVAVITIVAVDPLNFYRWNEGNRWLNPRYVTAGIIKNYDFDYAIIGSSLIQNMQMDWFREKGYRNPVKITKGGMDVNEELLCLKLMKERGKNTDILLNIDVPGIIQASDIYPDSDVYPDYQFTHTSLDDYRYWFGFESWGYYLPITTASVILPNFNITLPSFIQAEMDVDKIDEWIDEYDFGRDIVLLGYQNSEYSVSSLDQSDRTKIMKNVDNFVAYLKKYLPTDRDTVVAFPPYSILYWADALNSGNMDEIIYCKEYLTEKVLELPRVKIIDMQANPDIKNLELYKDTTHYNLKLQKQYADAALQADEKNFSLPEVKMNDEILFVWAAEFLAENQELFNSND